MGDCLHLDARKTGTTFYVDPPEHQWKCEDCESTWVATEDEEEERVEGMEGAVEAAGDLVGDSVS